MTPTQMQLCKWLVQGEADQIETLLTTTPNCLIEEDERGFSPALFCLALMHHPNLSEFAAKLQLCCESSDAIENAASVTSRQTLLQIIHTYVLPKINVADILNKIYIRLGLLSSQQQDPKQIFLLDCFDAALISIPQLPRFDESQDTLIISLRSKCFILNPERITAKPCLPPTSSAASSTSSTFSRYNESWPARAASFILPTASQIRSCNTLPVITEEDEGVSAAAEPATTERSSSWRQRTRAYSAPRESLRRSNPGPSPLRNTHSDEAMTSEPMNDRRPPSRKK